MSLTQEAGSVADPDAPKNEAPERAWGFLDGGGFGICAWCATPSPPPGTRATQHGKCPSCYSLETPDEPTGPQFALHSDLGVLHGVFPTRDRADRYIPFLVARGINPVVVPVH